MTPESNGTASNCTFFEELVGSLPGGDPRLDRCIQCGTCGGSCPSAADMDHTPRVLFAMIGAGMREEVLRSNTPWYCVSCYYCTVRCPQQIRITDVMYGLKRMAIREGHVRKSSIPSAADFSSMFIDSVERYGRSFALGLGVRFNLKYHPIRAAKMAGPGWKMFRNGRMDLTPARIKNIDQLRAIIARAKELGGVE